MPKLVWGHQMPGNRFCRHESSIGKSGLAEVMALWVLVFTFTGGERACKQVKDYTYPLTMTAWSSFFSLGEHALLT